ncbi:MAG: epoxide hydrolase family protein [Deinococcota bacterium]
MTSSKRLILFVIIVLCAPLVTAQESAVETFEISITQAVLDDLETRLDQTRYPDQITGAGWQYGMKLEYLQSLLTYWQNEFDWRAQEARLNSFNHFLAEVDDTRVHFIYERGEQGNNDILPVLVLHGWPSSFVQMLELIPLLTEAHDGLSFDVVVPSLVGYGFSDIPDEPGMSVAVMAELFHTLMTETLGYERYAVRGSDLGAGVIQQIALLYPESIVGVHLSGTNPFVAFVPDDMTDAEQAFVSRAQAWFQQEMSYAMQHSSYPQTLAYALNDSPAGLAAWIMEKFWAWTDHEDDLESVLDRDELLTNLVLYWATKTINSSMRLYYEVARDPGQFGFVTVPTGMLMSDADFFPTPREWAARSYNIVHWTPIERGGHFLEWEIPSVVADDMRLFFNSLVF